MRSAQSVFVRSASRIVAILTVGLLVAWFNPAAAGAATAAPAFSIKDTSVTEGNTGTTNVTFTVTLSAKVNKSVSVQYKTRDGSAKAGSDYNATSGTITFSANQTSATKTVQIKNDTTSEPTEYFFVDLSKNSSGTSIARANGCISIYDNDPKADLSVSISDAPDPVQLGQNITYTITVKNNGSSTAQSPRFVDNLPSSVQYVSAANCTYNSGNKSVTCSQSSLNSGSSFTRTIVVKTLSSGTVNNTASTSSNTYDPNTGNNSASASTTVKAQSADLSITKTSPKTAVNDGSDIDFTIVVKNNGSATAQNVVLTDPIPSNATFDVAAITVGWLCKTSSGPITCSTPSLAVGASATFHFYFKPTSSATSIANTATISSSTADPNKANNSASATTTLTKPATADVSVSITDTPDPVVIGQEVAYDVTVTNAGPAAANGVVVTDYLPSGTTYTGGSNDSGVSCTGVVNFNQIVCTLADPLASGDSKHFQVDIRIDPTDDDSVTDTASATTTTAESDTTNNTANQTTTLKAPNADVSISITDTPDPVAIGNEVAYDVTVTNNGPDVAKHVVATDFLPSGTTYTGGSNDSGVTCTGVVNFNQIVCTIADPLASGASKHFQVDIRVDPTDDDSVTDTASVTSDDDQNPANNSASETTTLRVLTADVKVSVTDDPDPAFSGNEVAYNVTITNDGPDAAVGVVATNTLPANTTYSGGSNDSGVTCTGVSDENQVTCTVADPLASGASKHFQVTIIASPTGAASITDSVSVSATTYDNDSTNNSASQTTTLQSPSDISVSMKPDNPFPHAGDLVTYGIDVKNNGPKDSSWLYVSIGIAQDMPVQSISDSGCTDFGAGQFQCYLADGLANGATYHVDVTAKVASDATPLGTHTAITSVVANKDTNTSNNVTTASIVVSP